MRNVRSLLKQGERIVRSNSPTILTGLGIGGVVTTAYLAHQAGWNSALDLYDDVDHPEIVPFKEKAIRYWKNYIPAVTVGAVTIGCVIAATHVGLRRTAAMAAAYSVSEKAFSEYRDKVEEKYGKNKEQAVRDEIAQDNVTKTAPGPSVVLLGGGNTIFYEYFTGRYFLSDMESIHRAENEINRRVLTCDYATLAEFHTLIGQPPTQGAMDMGWSKPKLLEIEISACLTHDDSKAAIEFRYNYLDAL